VKNRGFTLLELLVVLVILSIVIAIITPRIKKSLDTLQLKTSTRHLAATLRVMRSEAIAKKKTSALLVNLDDQTLTGDLPEGGSEAFPEGIKISQVTVGEEEVSSGEAKFKFFPKGNISGGEIVLENNLGWSSRITLDRITGRVKIAYLGEGEG